MTGIASTDSSSKLKRKIAPRREKESDMIQDRETASKEARGPTRKIVRATLISGWLYGRQQTERELAHQRVQLKRQNEGDFTTRPFGITLARH